MAAKPKAVFIIGILAVAIAAVASISLYNYLKRQTAKVQEAVATGSVVVARTDIPVGSTINNTQVKTANWPKNEMPPGQIFSSPDQVVGRVALEKIFTGDPIVGAKLVPQGGQAGILSYKIPEGHRAMTVAVDQVAGVAGFISPGNRVDVVLTTSTGKQSVSKIVLQDVPVLATGQVVSQQEGGKPKVVPTVTMDVSPENAEKLAIASTQGRLQLVLRRAGDADIAKTTGATVAKVMGGVPATRVRTRTIIRRVVKKNDKPQKAAEVINVEILKGSKKETATFKVEQ
ncbi:MAG: Flp pilus assembly protein CpaB [Candidatus Sulfobium sp.]|jgi:pilus assembly protein CpaB